MNRVRERITDIRMTDQGCMLRAYGRNVVQAINACREASTFIPALGYTFSQHPAEVEVAHEERSAGLSKYSFYRLLRLNFDLVTGFSLVPLQLFSLLGMLVAIGSVLLYLVVLSLRLLAGGDWSSLWLALWDRDVLVFFLLGIVLFGLGLVGEYVGRIYEQVRGRPRYLVGTVLEKRD
jgi:undecaprenyl-phosphate 4-deoxy-4-formamido-L-arabinose transferase